MTATDSHDTGALKAALAASEARAAAAEAQIAALTLMIEKLRRALYGRRSERSERLLGQLELALDELTASATEDELAAEKAAAASTEVKAFVRRKPSRKPFPDHLPRERVVVPASSCHPWQPEHPGPKRRTPRRAQRSYTTPRDTILLAERAPKDCAF